MKIICHCYSKEIIFRKLFNRVNVYDRDGNGYIFFLNPTVTNFENSNKYVCK